MIAGGLAGGTLALSGGNLPATISQLLQNISFRTLREAFKRIAESTPDFSPAVSKLLKWAGPVGVLINSFLEAINMAQVTESNWKGLAAGIGTFLLGIAALATLGWLLPGLGVVMIVVVISAIAILTAILQSILLELIFTAWLPVKRRFAGHSILTRADYA